MRSKHYLLKNPLFLFFFICFWCGPVLSQPFNPVAVSGYNQDVIAETGNSSLTTTTSALDGVTVSNKVMYTLAFRTANGFAGGGLPNNGVIPDATAGSYQLAAYNANNALIVPRSQNGDLILTTPASYSTIRVMAFSTEGSSLINVTLFFSDGTSTNALAGYTLPDWFNGTTNVVLQGFGRCTRATPASGADAYPTNPRLYYFEMTLSCADRAKNLQRINFANVTTAGSNAPFPNAVFFSVSARTTSQNIVSTITNATCSTTGSATLNVTGSASPYTIAWNTIPVQNGPTATNLAPGNYIATISDAGGCTTTSPVTIGLTNNLTMTVPANTTICPGGSLNANVQSNATSYSWSPATGVSNPAIANPVLSPASTTTYTVTGTTGTCTITRSFTVTVATPIVFNVQAAQTICLGNSFTPNNASDATSFSWQPATGVSNPAILNPVLTPTTTTTYTINATTGTCTTSRSFTLTVVPGVTVNAGNDVTVIEGQSIQLSGSGSSGTYLWSPSAGLSSTSILNPTATPATTITYVLQLTSPMGCIGTDDVTITVLPYCIKPMEAITPNGDGRNDRWLITNGNCLSSARVKVFNRYGTLVYESADYKNDWEGTYKGKPVPDATYYFVIEYHLLNGRTTIVNGNLTILR
jgi:gliding motility-associated-like protein